MEEIPKKEILNGADRPSLNTATIDLADYAAQRQEFFKALTEFKNGDAARGFSACGYLQNMYYLLPATKHIYMNREGSRKFIDGIDSLRTAIRVYVKRKDPMTSYAGLADYERELGDKMDDLIVEFFRIMYECGYTK